VHLFAVHPFLSVTRRMEWIASWTASVGTFTKRLWLLWSSWFAAISVFCVSAAVCDVCAPEMCMLVTNVNYKFGDRSFSAAGPRLWNDLPPGLRRPGLTFDSFRQSPKSHLFGDRSTQWLCWIIGAIQHTHTPSFNDPLSGTTRVGWYQKKYSSTHAHPVHQKFFINFLRLLQSVASSLFNLRAWQFFSTTPLQVLFDFPLGLGPCTSYSMHFFTQSWSSSRK